MLCTTGSKPLTSVIARRFGKARSVDTCYPFYLRGGDSESARDTACYACYHNRGVIVSAGGELDIVQSWMHGEVSLVTTMCHERPASAMTGAKKEALVCKHMRAVFRAHRRTVAEE